MNLGPVPSKSGLINVFFESTSPDVLCYWCESQLLLFSLKFWISSSPELKTAHGMQISLHTNWRACSIVFCKAMKYCKTSSLPTSLALCSIISLLMRTRSSFFFFQTVHAFKNRTVNKLFLYLKHGTKLRYTQLHGIAPLSTNGPPEIDGTTYGVIYHYPLWIWATVNKLWKPYSSYSCAWWLVVFQCLLNINKWNKVGDSDTLISVSTGYTFVPSVWAIRTLHKYFAMPVGSHAKL